MDWHTLIRGTDKYPDGQVIDAPDGSKVSLGDLRKAFWEREASITARENEIKSNASKIYSAREELANVYTALSAEKEKLQAAAERIAASERVSQSYEDTSMLEPGAERIAALEGTLREISGGLKKLSENQVEMVKAYLSKTWDSDMESVKKEYGDMLPDGVTREALVRLAMNEGFIDRETKTPSIKRAAAHVTAEKRRERDLEAAREEGYKKAEEDLAMRQAAGRGGRFRVTDVDSPAGDTFKDMDDAFAQAAKDLSIWNSTEN